MDPASYEAHLVQRAFQYTGFFLLTYGSLQVAALVFCKGWLRAVAALPLIVMVPIIIAGANPNSHRDGSLYGLVVYVPYLPVMIYLVAVLVGPRRPKVCPHCGRKTRVTSFQMMRSATRCDECGKPLSENAPAEQSHAPETTAGPDSNE